MEKISNRALISRLYSSANDQLEAASFDIENWKEWYNTVQELTVPEKMVYLIVKLNQAVTNGGFAEFYETSFGIFTPEIAHVLTEIQSVKTAKIVNNTLTIVNPSGLLDDAYKEFIFHIKPSKEQRINLYSCDIQYDNLQDHENLEDLLGNYLQGLTN